MRIKGRVYKEGIRRTRNIFLLLPRYDPETHDFRWLERATIREYRWEKPGYWSFDGFVKGE